MSTYHRSLDNGFLGLSYTFFPHDSLEQAQERASNGGFRAGFYGVKENDRIVPWYFDGVDWYKVSLVLQGDM